MGTRRRRQRPRCLRACMPPRAQSVRNLTPSQVAQGFVEICSNLAMRLAPLSPLLERRPELLHGPAHGVRWAQLQELRDVRALQAQALHAGLDDKTLQVRRAGRVAGGRWQARSAQQATAGAATHGAPTLPQGIWFRGVALCDAGRPRRAVSYAGAV